MAYFGVDMLTQLQRDRRRAKSLLDLATHLAVLVHAPSCPPAHARSCRSSKGHVHDLVTGAFSYSGSHIAGRLLASGPAA